MNLFVSSDTLPHSMRETLVTSLLKQAILDPGVLKKYRPVSNLSFTLKIIEKVVANRLGATYGSVTSWTICNLLSENRTENSPVLCEE